MTRDEATRMLQAFYRQHGLMAHGLDENGLSGVMHGTAQLYFEYDDADGMLLCRALIYKFQKEPHPKVIEKFREEEKAGEAETGGGQLEYMPDNRGLYLSRAYTEAASFQKFDDDMRKLADSSILWGNAVAQRVAAQVFHPNEAHGKV